MDKRRLLCTLVVLILLSGVSNADNYTRRLVDSSIMADMKALFDNFAISEEIMSETEKMRDNLLGSEVINNAIKELSEELNACNINSFTDIPPKATITIFISASVPMVTLRNYAMAADEKTRFVLRGTVGKDPSKLKPTMDFVANILCGTKYSELRRDTRCVNVRIDIDPPLFREYGIRRVPTIIVETESGVYRHVGAMPVQYVLDKIGGKP